MPAGPARANHRAAVAQRAETPVDSLADALATERRLLEELIGVMRRQRDAIDSDDLQAIEDSVFATHRVLVTLNEARRHRRTLYTLIGQEQDLAIHALDEVLGTRMTAELRAARDELHDAARALSREVSTNRSRLRDTLAHSGEHPIAHSVRAGQPAGALSVSANRAARRPASE
jgi:hypothetical protein